MSGTSTPGVPLPRGYQPRLASLSGMALPFNDVTLDIPPPLHSITQLEGDPPGSNYRRFIGVPTENPVSQVARSYREIPQSRDRWEEIGSL